MTQLQNKKTDKNNWLSWWYYWRQNPFQNLGTEDIMIEDDLFDSKDPGDIIDTSKDIISEIKENDPFLDFSIPTSEIIVGLFDPSDDSDKEQELIIAETVFFDDDISIPGTNQIGIDNGPPQHKKIVTTHMTKAVKAAEKIKKNTKSKKNRRVKEAKIKQLLTGWGDQDI